LVHYIWKFLLSIALAFVSATQSPSSHSLTMEQVKKNGNNFYFFKSPQLSLVA
jgi:hypothetical protein